MKKKTLQKISRLFASLVLVGAMSLGTVATANAAGSAMTWDETKTPKAAFTVEYKRATGVEIPATNFVVTFEKAGFKQDDKGALASTLTDKNKMPAISDKTVSFAQKEATVKKECPDFLEEFVNALKTPANTHGAGIYLYNVAQKTPSVKKNNSQDELTASTDKYLVKVYVAQKSDGSGLYIKGLVVNEGTVETPGTDKVDATPGGSTGGSTSGMVFTNEYIAKNGTGGGDDNKPKPDDPATYGLKVKKVVAGANADTNKEFTYTMKITKPADLSLKDTQYTFYKVEANGTSVGTAEKGDYGIAKTFKLKANESILVKSCYAGSALEIEETGASNWTPQVKVVLNGIDLGTTDGIMGTNLKYTSDDTNKIGQKTNTVDYTNTYLDNPVTGIIVNNFPFVMMIVMAMAAFVAIVAVKSRRRMNER